MNPNCDAALLVRVLALPAKLRPVLQTSLEAVGGLAGLMNIGAEAMPELTARQARRLEAFVELQRRLLEPGPPADIIDGPLAVVDYLGEHVRHQPTEHFWIVMLDAKSRPIGKTLIAQGTLTACLVHPREVFAPAIRARAATIVVVHNHPSGDPWPSDEDIAITRRLAEAGRILGIPMVDHVVVGRRGTHSIGGGHLAFLPKSG